MAEYNMDIRFDGKRALVTGGARGIGKGIAIGLLNAGAEVYVLGKSKEHLDKLKAERPSIHTVQADLVDWGATRTAVESIGHVDLLVNNAGVHEVANFMNTSKEGFEKIMDINLKGAFNVSQVVAKAMISKKSGGSIVNISSVDSTIPCGEAMAYSVSKAGMDMMSKVMTLELGPHNIRVNTVHPTWVPSDMTEYFFADKQGTEYLEYLKRHPLGTFAEKKDVVHATLFLLSNKASMISGAKLPVDCGFLVT